MQESTWIIGQEPQVHLLGRAAPDSVPFRPYWSGSGVELRVQCRQLRIELELPQEDAFHCVWILVCVDGAPAARFPAEPGRRCYTVLAGMDPAFAHTISILRDSQPIQDCPATTWLLMHTIRSDGQLLPLPDPGMTIEFIGDSLTTGEGIVGPQGAMEWQTVWMSSYNYTHMVCQELAARRRIISQSGWGVFTSWDNDPACTLPRIYDQVCAIGNADPSPYDFARSKADVVVINLGTNDSGAITRIEEAARRQRRKDIQAAAEEFLRQVRRDNPSAWILWVYGMCGHPLAPLFRRAVETVRNQGDDRVDYLPLPGCPAAWNGSREHPGLRNHRAVADRILRWIRSRVDQEPSDSNGKPCATGD